MIRLVSDYLSGWTFLVRLWMRLGFIYVWVCVRAWIVLPIVLIEDPQEFDGTMEGSRWIERVKRTSLVCWHFLIKEEESLKWRVYCFFVCFIPCNFSFLSINNHMNEIFMISSITNFLWTLIFYVPLSQCRMQRKALSSRQDKCQLECLIIIHCMKYW
jgi:hypothetical protein